MARDVRVCREFWSDGFGLRTFEIIRQDDGSEDGAWLSSTVQGHEVIYGRDYLSGAGRPAPPAGFIRMNTPRSS